jgi:hypothetical protein
MENQELKVKRESPHQVLEDAGMAYDPGTQYLDLSKEEKRRVTALLMAIQAYNNIIIKDADLYSAVVRDAGRDPEAPKIHPATMDAMLEAAIKFDRFISGSSVDKRSGEEPAKSAEE